jgi:hypothetical protein
MTSSFLRPGRTWFLFCAAVVTACSATGVPDENAPSSAESEDAVISAPAPSNACANRQNVGLATPATKAANHAQFLARNPGAWNPNAPSWAFDSFTGGLQFSHRTDAIGPRDPALTQTDASRKARAFVVENWDLFGLRSKDAAVQASVTSEAVRPEYSGGGFAWSARVILDETQIGYEAIAGATQHLHFIVDVAVDGVVRQFTTVDTRYVPKLSLDVVPVTTEAQARASVVGTHLVRYPGPYEIGWGTVQDFGYVTPTDITKTSLLVFPDWSGVGVGATSITMKLAHEVTVEKPGVRATFLIDTCTGTKIGEDVYPAL